MLTWHGEQVSIFCRLCMPGHRGLFSWGYESSTAIFMSAWARVGAPSPAERVRHRPAEVPGAPPVRNQSLSCVRPLRPLQGLPAAPHQRLPGAASLHTVPKKRDLQRLPRLPEGVREKPGGCAEEEEEEEKEEEEEEKEEEEEEEGSTQ